MRVEEYVEEINRVVFTPCIERKLHELYVCLSRSKGNNLIIGNGGSSATAGHVAEDYTKILGFPTQTLHCPQLMTCFANDYGWDEWMAHAIKLFRYSPGSVLIALSVSGESRNIVHAVTEAINKGLKVVTFTGPIPNTLSTFSVPNFHVNSDNYNMVEIVHMIWLLSLCERK